jgi:uncharacterized protein (TIGR00369 family)
VDGGIVRLDYTTREADLGYRRIVHGGIAMTLLDEVMTWAAIIAARRVCVAAEMTARLIKPIGVGVKLRVEGRITGGRARLFLTEGGVFDERGEALAAATGKYVPMDAGEAALCAADFVESGDSIPAEKLLAR